MTRKTSGRGWILDLNQQQLSPPVRGRGRLMERLGITPCVASGEFSTKTTSPLEQPKELPMFNLNQQQLSPPVRGRGRLMEKLGITPCVASRGTSRKRLMKATSDLATEPTSQSEQPKEVGVLPMLNDHTIDKLSHAVGNLSISNKTEQSVLPEFTDNQPLNTIHKSLAPGGTIIKLADVVNLQNWMLIHSENDFIINEFVKHLEMQFPLIAVNFASPTIVHIQSYQVKDYIKVLKDNIGKGFQIVTCIVDPKNPQVFDAIKEICYEEMKIPSQVILNSTVSNVYNNNILQSIAMQLKFKLSGSIWKINVPSMSAMFCGIVSYKNKVTVITATTDISCTNMYCKGILQENENQIVTELCSSLIFALIAYQKNNDCLPEKIFIFRAAIHELNTDAANEISQFQRACSTSFDNYKPKITFIVIQRVVVTNSNQIGNTFAQKYRCEFTLDWKSSPNGPALGTRFVVVHDDLDFSPAFLKELIKKLHTTCIYVQFKEPIPFFIKYAKNMLLLFESSQQLK